MGIPVAVGQRHPSGAKVAAAVVEDLEPLAIVFDDGRVDEDLVDHQLRIGQVVAVGDAVAVAVDGADAFAVPVGQEPHVAEDQELVVLHRDDAQVPVPARGFGVEEERLIDGSSRSTLRRWSAGARVHQCRVGVRRRVGRVRDPDLEVLGGFVPPIGLVA